jgi:hypothetical protein
MRARTFSPVDLDNLAPRAGVNWQVSPAGAIRAAYGLFYGGLGYQAPAQSGLANAPYYVRKTIRSLSTQISSLVLGQGFRPDALDPAKATNPPDAFSLAGNLPLGRVHQWNLSVDREFFSSTRLIASYVGSVSSQLRGVNNINAAIQGSRPFPTFGEILETSNFVKGSYHALQVSADQRLTHGMAFIASYTWGHAIDNATDLGDTASPITPQNPRNPGAERASSVFDVRHRLVASVIYESPAAAPLWLGGWRIAGVFAAQTGYPLTPTLRPNATFSTVLRPDCVGDANLPRSERTPDRWFDVDAFRVPSPIRFGNCGRNVLRGPGYLNLDLSLSRGFRVTHHTRLELRAEVFNVANAVHLGPPATVIDVPGQPGRITSTQAPPRQAQLGVRLLF